jgi:hypothetical protein
MAYYPDLGNCSYFGKNTADRLIAVGWLDNEHPYSKGPVNEIITDKIVELLVKPWAPMYFLGYADCPYCAVPSHILTHKGKTIAVGAYNLFVPGQNVLYVAPSLIPHYIITHGYSPPAAFCDTVLQCPPMNSPAYFQAIINNGPAYYMTHIRSDYHNSTQAASQERRKPGNRFWYSSTRGAGGGGRLSIQ